MNPVQKLKPKNVPIVNKKFIFSALKDSKRIDGRSLTDYRNLSIGFGLDYGSSIVSLGGTRVMCNITHKIAEPKSTKSCEGFLNVKIDLSATMVYSHEKLVEIMKIIEKNIKESKCLDFESLCLVSGKKVYSLEADLIVMNDEGNLIECCSIALLASLSHFRRPDVTVIEEKIRVHSFADRNPIPLNILHYPFCTSFTFFGTSQFVCDPSQIEEKICDGYLIVGANIYREITIFHISGKSAITKDIGIKCCQLAVERSITLTKIVKSFVEKDIALRVTEGLAIGYVPVIKENTSFLCFQKNEVKIAPVEEKYAEEDEVIVLDYVPNSKMFRYASDTFGLRNSPNSNTDTNWQFIDEFKEADGCKDKSVKMNSE